MPVHFGEIAIKNELISFEQLWDALALQSRSGDTRRIGEWLVSLGYLTHEQASEIMSEVKKLNGYG